MLQQPVTTIDTAEVSQKAEVILAHARQAFVDKGFDGASMQDLARAAGMSAGNFYRYFPSKAALVAALIARDLQEIDGIFRAIIASPDPLAAFRAGLRVRLIEKCEGDDRLWAEIAATASRKPEVTAALGSLEDGISRFMAQVLGHVAGLSENEAQARLGTHARLIFLIIHGVMCGPSTKGSPDGGLIDLVLKTIDGVIDDALAQAKDH
ncbi:MAG TPA: TetR/AcrR family transcriptional regulator [Rubellimicrobium sp.]|nr:TetR/AcrR family transcriptional regulator [Rubellimicrobium sp.]